MKKMQHRIKPMLERFRVYPEDTNLKSSAPANANTGANRAAINVKRAKCTQQTMNTGNHQDKNSN
jgi:hypothetical protein